MEALTIDTSLERLTKRREQLLTTLRYLDSQQIEVEQNTDCHEPIEPKRMAIVPDAESCAACQNFRAGLEHSTA